MKAWITQVRKGLLDLLLLNVLAQGESYGYEIVRHLCQTDGLQVGESTLYPALERLRKDGYVRVRRVPSPTGPVRRYYSLTRAGGYRVGEMNSYWDSLNQALAGLRALPKGG